MQCELCRDGETHGKDKDKDEDDADDNKRQQETG